MRARFFIFALAIWLIAGCVAAIVVSAAAGLVVYDRRSISVLESDLRIFHLIRREIIADPSFRTARILVSSFNKVVLLVGQAPTFYLKSRAERIARKTPNVARVYNEIVVDYPILLTQRAEDSWITSQVRSLMLAKKGLESGSIRIVTENGVVYLMGVVTREQSNIATSVARQVAGVKKVVKVFQYIV